MSTKSKSAICANNEMNKSNIINKKVQFKACGKWILAGEHAVLRGHPAVVFPLTDFFVQIEVDNSRANSREDKKDNSWEVSQENGSFEFCGPFKEEFSLLFWGLLDRALSYLKKDRSQITGKIKIDCQIPLGSGLGASAALCVSLGRWFEYLNWLKNQELYDFAREMENLFHGESSGVDIAVALANQGLRFVRGGERSLIPILWKPQWYLSYCGERGVTAECVKKVKEWHERHPQLGREWDQQMAHASDQAQLALCAPQFSTTTRMTLLKSAIDSACDCFIKWGLCEGQLGSHLEWLKKQGALAVKPTGSGGGGYVLSLWSQTPPVEIQNQLISI